MPKTKKTPTVRRTDLDARSSSGSERGDPDGGQAPSVSTATTADGGPAPKVIKLEVVDPQDPSSDQHSRGAGPSGGRSSSAGSGSDTAGSSTTGALRSRRGPPGLVRLSDMARWTEEDKENLPGSSIVKANDDGTITVTIGTGNGVATDQGGVVVKILGDAQVTSVDRPNTLQLGNCPIVPSSGRRTSAANVAAVTGITRGNGAGTAATARGVAPTAGASGSGQRGPVAGPSTATSTATSGGRGAGETAPVAGTSAAATSTPRPRDEAAGTSSATRSGQAAAGRSISDADLMPPPGMLPRRYTAVST